MAFVADDLVAWLVGKLADAGSQRLITWAFGSDQERALRRAATAAVELTAAELRPEGGEPAVELAEVVNQVFGEPLPAVPQAGQATLLEMLQAGITRQLAVLDDAGITGTGQSSAETLGLSAGVLAERLASYLVREITFRGSRGGPLTPLADQLNQDQTHLQGQRIEDKVDRLTGEVRDVLARPGEASAVGGRPLDEVTDPFALEVHRPVQAEDPQPGLAELPAYVLRDHDAELGSVLRAAADGRSGIAVLVGGSSTGKTRACWEALQSLRDQEPGWRLWHPIDPTRPDAALRGLPGIGPRTVVWLNEAQFYLDAADGGLGERVAAGLRELLRDQARAPVLVLATLWPQFWDTLTARSAGGADQHAQARELLAGRDITVPAAFTPDQLQRLGEAGDARLAQAAAGAQDGQVIQFLAGAPELLARYRNAPPAAAALIHAAMDGRRLGMGIGLPQAFLEAAAPGYLTSTDWDALDEDWLEQALAYTAVPCKGVRGPLTRIRFHPARSRAPGPGRRDSGEQVAGGQAVLAGMPLYRLADYLEQHGRTHRKGRFPPADFWAAAAGHAFPGDQAALGDAANARGLYRNATQLHKDAAADGNVRAVFYLSNLPDSLPPDVRPVCWAAAHLSIDDPRAVASVLASLRKAGAQEQLTVLADRAASQVALGDPGAVVRLLASLRKAGAQEQLTVLADRAASQVALGDPGAVALLLERLREAGMREQVTTLLHRDPAAQVTLDDPHHVSLLVYRLWKVGAQEQLTTLLHRDPAGQVGLDRLRGVATLLDILRQVGAQEQLTALADRAAAQVCPRDPGEVARLLDSLQRAGTRDQVTVLADRAAAQVSLGHPYVLAELLDGLAQAGAEQLTVLADRAAAQVSLGSPQSVEMLLLILRRAGAHEQFAAVADRAASQVSLDKLLEVASLLDSLRQAGAHEQVTILADRAARQVCLDRPYEVGRLLDSLRQAGAHEQLTTLLRRDPAAQVSLDAPANVAVFLDSLRQAGAHEQLTTLLRRDPAAQGSLDYPSAADGLLDSLRRAGAHEQVAKLTDRLPGEGFFDDFLKQQVRRDQFRFGREPDGSPAAPWAWEDLDLRPCPTVGWDRLVRRVVGHRPARSGGGGQQVSATRGNGTGWCHLPGAVGSCQVTPRVIGRSDPVPASRRTLPGLHRLTRDCRHVLPVTGTAGFVTSAVGPKAPTEAARPPEAVNGQLI